MAAPKAAFFILQDDGENFLTELLTKFSKSKIPALRIFYCLGSQRENFSRRKICSQHCLLKHGFKRV
jgi:hypothetical protein